MYISFSDTALLKDIEEIYSQVIIEATKNGFLRPSIAYSLTQKNFGDNSGIGIPNFESIYRPEQEYIEHILSFKGCSAELVDAIKIMTTAMLENKDICIHLTKKEIQNLLNPENYLGMNDECIENIIRS